MKKMFQTLFGCHTSSLLALASLCLFLNASNGLAGTPAPAGLVGWWKGESNVVDSAGSANGYLTNGASYGPGKVGTGFSLDGVDDRVVVPDATAFNFAANQNFSVETWINALPTPDNYLGYTVIADKAYPGDASSVVGWMFYVVNGNLGFLMSQAPMTSGGASYWETTGLNLQDGFFHHVAVTVNRTSATGGKLYVDGSEVLTFNPAFQSGDLSNNAPLRIGNHNNPDFACNFKGIIDELSVYNRQITASEVSAIYVAAGAGKSTGPIAPYITMQPASEQVLEGNPVTLTVGAGGDQPLTYQWSYNSANISDGTNCSLTLNSFNASKVGNYAVVISNAFGVMTSSNAVLTLGVPILAPDGLVGWWKGESNVVDFVGGAAGYTTNGAGYGVGKVGAGFSFDGTNNRVIIPSTPVLNFSSNQNFSIETWIQAEPTPGNYNGITVIADKAVRYDPVKSAGWQFYMEGGRLGFQLFQSSIGYESHWTSPSRILQDSQFHHVAATIDRTSNTGGKLYVDGVLVFTFDPRQGSGGLSTDAPLYIGSHSMAEINAFYKGIIDEVSLYNRALTAADITAIYQAGGSGKRAEPILPFIMSQPVSELVVQGHDVTLRVVAGGTQPLTYQWIYNGFNYSDATNNSLSLTNFRQIHAGIYAVRISNAAGSITSSNAVLTLKTPIPVPQGLVGWWKGENNAMDSASTANGYETNGVGYGPGEVGTGFNLDGVDDCVIVPNSPTLNFGTNQNFSVEAWIQAQSTPNNTSGYTVIADKANPRDAGSVVGWMFYMEYGRLGFLMSQAPMVYGGASYWEAPGPNLQDGLFHHVAVTIDRTSNTGGKLYVDGSEVLTFNPTAESGDLSSIAPLRIGSHNNPDYASNFKGVIDELSVYNRQLTAAEINTIYQAEDSGKSTATVTPSIVAQPKSQEVPQGSILTLEVGVVGTQPFGFQWKFNGTDIDGAINNSLVINNFQLANAGEYSVVISNAIGTVTSSSAILTLKTSLPSPQGLVGWWKGENNVADAVGNANGYETNGAGYGSGQVGTGFSLNGTSSRVIIPSAPALNFGTNQNFSVETWIQAQPTSGNYNGITIIADKISRSNPNNTAGWQMYLESGYLGFQMIQGAITSESHWTSRTLNLQDGLFHHVAATVDRSSTTGGKLYVDGNLVLTFDPTSKSGDLSSDAPLFIGNHGDLTLNCFFKGIIDEFSVYNRQLTAAEVMAIYQIDGAGKSTEPAAPVILAQPASREVGQGGSVTLEVGVLGTQPLAYQWRFNDTNLEGATNNALKLSNFQSVNAGSYGVIVSNALGSVTSSNVILTLKMPIQVPQGLVGWWKGESNILDTFSLTSGYATNGADYGPAKVGTGFTFDGTNDRVIVPNAGVLNFGSNQNFSVETWIQAQPTPLNASAIADIVVKASTPDSSKSVGWALVLQSGRLCFQMSRAPMAVGNTTQWASSGPTLLDGKFHHVAATVNRTSATGGKLYVDGIVVRTFDPRAENGDLSTDGPLFIGGSDNPSLNVFFKGTIDELSIYNRELSSTEIGAISQSAEAGKAIQAFAPIITTQPADQRVAEGSSVAISVGITGTPPFDYQWSMDGSNMPLATNCMLVINNAQIKDTGHYSVVVANSAGAVTSLNALLTVLSPIPVPQGMVGWWKGESNALDSVSLTSGNATNGAGYAPGKVGTGFSFDGVNDQVVVPNVSSLNFGPNQNFSMETWIQAQSMSGNYYDINIIAAKSSTPDITQSLGWQLYLQYGRLGFLMATPPMSPANYSAWVAPSPDVRDGKFHHVAVTVDRSSHTGGKMYVDGSLVLTFDPTARAGDLSTAEPLYIGSQDNPSINDFFKGIVDEFSLYNRDLTATEISSIYQVADIGKSMQPFAPVITAQPVSQTVSQGKEVILNVAVAGTPPFTYQWTFNGANINGATNGTLVLSSFQSADAGSYAVVITNPIGSSTSSNALLTLLTPLQVPEGLAGWWRGENNALDVVTGTSGYATNGAGYAPGKVGIGFTFDGVNDQVVIPNSAALNFGPNQNFSIETWIQAQSVPGNYYDINIIAGKSSTPDITQSLGWQLYLQYGRLGFLMATPPMSPANYSAWVAPSPNLQDGKFHHVAVTVDRSSHSGGKMYVDGSLVLNFDPTSRAGDLSTDGPLYIGSQDNPSINDFFKGIVDEFSLYNRELTATEISSIYQVSELGKFVQPSAPVIATQPVSQRIVRGQSVTMEVGAGGTQPLAFQWLFNGSEMAGQTNASLVLTNVQFAQAGSYAVKVSNALGFVTSGDAILKVDFPPATVYVADASGSASLPITVPVVLEANGNENAVSFSVNFDPALLTFANVVNGSGAVGGSLFSNTNMVGSGKLGLILALPSGSVFSAGSQEVVKVMFNAARTLPGSTTVSLGNQPTLSQLSDVLAESLAVNFESGLVSILAADFEGDISPRPTGDKYVTLTDWVLEGRFVARLDDPATESEFQRADCAPQSTRGDGAITVFDWVQVGRYAVGMDAPVPAGGPLSEVEPLGTLAKDSSIITTDGSGCEVKIVELNLVQGRSGTVSVVLDAQGTENALAFSLAFDPTAIGFVSASLGSGAAGAMLNVNTNQAGAGHVGFAMALSPGQTFGTGIKEILKLNVQVAASATPGPSSFTFTDVPVIRGVSDAGVNKVPATFTHGVVDVNSSIPTLHISRLDDQVVLSWPDWGTNFLLQITGNSSTNLIWTNSVATTTVANGECAVKLPASAQTELYRLIQSGTQGGDIVTKQLEKPSVSAAPNK